ncbi:uncharacterized protein LOC135348714 [Halichondria panicea]|uniref:uncharacterized protein LOC135348714 n=1 Tax=Halichondria panicea TaxID=6063 RepID=UPI00312B530A
MTLEILKLKLIGVLLICFLAGFSTAQYSVSVERPCPMETVTFTCTAPGDSLRWEAPGIQTITIRSTSGLNIPVMQSGYTVTLTAFNDSTLTSTLSRTVENGITVSCEYALPVLTTVGSSTIILADTPDPPSNVRQSVLSSSADEVRVYVQWDPPTETGGRDDLTYTVTVSSPVQLSATVLTSTSVTVIAQYNVDYTVSVVATNCAGSSTTTDYNFTIGGCPVLTNPTNGAFGPTTSRLPGSTVTTQCDAGYVSAIAMVTCEGTLMWSPDPDIECMLTTPSPTPSPTMNCRAPLSPPWNGSVSDHSVPAIPGARVTFQCDAGLFPEGIMTATCLATGEWDKNPGEIVCRIESISCVLPARPFNGVLLNTNCQNTNLAEGSVITFQCDPGFSLVGEATATCNNSGLWDPDPALWECSPTATTTLSTGVTVAIGVTTTFVVSTILGFLAGLLVMYSFTRKKAVYYTRKTALSVIEPTKPVGPVYEEVSPKEEIELNTNQAYGPVGL